MSGSQQRDVNMCCLILALPPSTKISSQVIFSDASTVLSAVFGVSTVIEGLSLTESGLRATRLRSSGHRGSTRWMAPEFLIELVDDEVPQITTATFALSDAYVWRWQLGNRRMLTDGTIRL